MKAKRCCLRCQSGSKGHEGNLVFLAVLKPAVNPISYRGFPFKYARQLLPLNKGLYNHLPIDLYFVARVSIRPVTDFAFEQERQVVGVEWEDIDMTILAEQFRIGGRSVRVELIRPEMSDRQHQRQKRITICSPASISLVVTIV